MTLKKLCLILLTTLLIPISAIADDTEIFSECSSNVKPNILFLFDTSMSMRKQDVIDDSIKDYNHYITDWGAEEYKVDANGNFIPLNPADMTTPLLDENGNPRVDADGNPLYEPYERKDWAKPGSGTFTYSSDFYKLMYKHTSSDVWWKDFIGLAIGNGISHYDNVHDDPAGSCNPKTELHDNGYFTGRLCQFCGECHKWHDGWIIIPERSIRLRNYINYLDYVDKKMNEISFEASCLGPLDDEKDLQCYNANRDYYNFYKDSSGNVIGGYGDYPEKDRVYVQMGMDRPFIALAHPGGISVSEIDCTAVRNDLATNGWSKGRIWEAFDGDCNNVLGFIPPPNYFLKTANFMNFLDMKLSRRYNGINAVWRVMKEKYADARFGMMQFDLGQYWTIAKSSSFWESQGGDLSIPCGSSKAHLDRFQKALFGHYQRQEKWSDPKPSEYGQPLYFGWEGYIFSDTSKETPLAEALVEAGLYFSGQQSWYNQYEFPAGFFNTVYANGATIPVSDAADSHVSVKSGGDSYSYESPIQCADQQNHVIVITDGAPNDDFSAVKLTDLLGPNLWTGNFSCKWINTNDIKTYDPSDNSSSTTNIGDYVDYRTDTQCSELPSKQQWIDDVSGFLYDSDLSPLDGTQELTTHIVSFRLERTFSEDDRALLKKTAEVGGQGVYNESTNQDDLVRSINSIIDSVTIQSTFSSAVTPVRQDDMTYSGDTTYLTAFRIDAGSRGNGNIKQYKLGYEDTTHDDSQIKKYQIMGKLEESDDPAPLFTNNGTIDSDVRDLWGTSPQESDSKTPTEGAAFKLWQKLDSFANTDSFRAKTPAEQLNIVAGQRNIFTYDGSTTDHLKKLALDSKTLDINNFSGTPMSEADITTLLLNGLYGIGLDWPLGDIVHSGIVLGQYPINGSVIDTQGVIFTGTNDGMLHAFDADTGEELWAFVPPDFLLNKIYSLNTSVHNWYTDGFIDVFHDSKNLFTPAYIIFGERRGGSTYHLLDISTKEKPQYLKGIAGSTVTGEIWGQSWGMPRFCKIANGNSLQFGFMLPGGYDERYDSPADASKPDIPWFPSSADSIKVKGNFISILSLDDNTLGNEIITLGSDIIENSVISARIIDATDDRSFTRIHLGDLGGNVYSFADDLKEDGSTKAPDGSWEMRQKLFKGRYFDNVPVSTPTIDNPENTTNTRIYQKILYSPVMSRSCTGNMVFFGTGDRERPNTVYGVDYYRDSFYSVKDYLPTPGNAPLEADDLAVISLGYPVSRNKNGTEYNDFPDITKSNDALAYTNGWYFDFSFDGEKVISEPILIGDLLVFGTYTPETTNNGDNSGAGLCDISGCSPGSGRIYMINTCYEAFTVKAIVTGDRDPMPQPAIVFGKDSGKVYISTGDGNLHDSGVSVLSGNYWQNSY